MSLSVRVLLLDPHQNGLGGVRLEEAPAGAEHVVEVQVLVVRGVVDRERVLERPAADVQEADPTVQLLGDGGALARHVEPAGARPGVVRTGNGQPLYGSGVGEAAHPVLRGEYAPRRGGGGSRAHEGGGGNGEGAGEETTSSAGVCADVPAGLRAHAGVPP